mgnify:CR=1 FL=1
MPLVRLKHLLNMLERNPAPKARVVALLGLPANDPRIWNT